MSPSRPIPIQTLYKITRSNRQVVKPIEFGEPTREVSRAHTTTREYVVGVPASKANHKDTSMASQFTTAISPLPRINLQISPGSASSSFPLNPSCFLTFYVSELRTANIFCDTASLICGSGLSSFGSSRSFRGDSLHFHVSSCHLQ